MEGTSYIPHVSPVAANGGFPMPRIGRPVAVGIGGGEVPAVLRAWAGPTYPLTVGHINLYGTVSGHVYNVAAPVKYVREISPAEVLALCPEAGRS